MDMDVRPRLWQAKCRQEFANFRPIAGTRVLPPVAF
jgi:hypothetical protein